jgi:protein phosphatase
MTVQDRVLESFARILSLPAAQVGEIGTRFPLPSFPVSHVLELVASATSHFSNQPSLLELDPPIYLIGDIHGNIFDLVRLLVSIPHAPDAHILFLGDYVDRGDYSVQVVMLLFALMLRFPDSIFLLRGNHEFASVNSRYGFQTELVQVFGDESGRIFQAFNRAFEWIPISALISSDILVVHGGISPRVTKIADLQQIQRPVADYEEGFLADIMWSDPSPTVEGFEPNTRGSGRFFGVHAARRFALVLGLRHIVRAHQCVALGVEQFANGIVHTVFSSSNYQGPNSNACGLLYCDDSGTLMPYSLPPLAHLPRDQAVFEQDGARRPLAAPSALPGVRRGSIGLVQIPIVSSSTPEFPKSKTLLAGKSVRRSHLLNTRRSDIGNEA